jgi:hypothetical protein
MIIEALVTVKEAGVQTHTGADCVCCAIETVVRLASFIVALSIAESGNSFDALIHYPLGGRTVQRYYIHMRIVLTRDRTWSCDDLAIIVVQRLITRFGRDVVIIHGGSPGVDESFNKACKSLGIAVESRVAN